MKFLNFGKKEADTSNNKGGLSYNERIREYGAYSADEGRMKQEQERRKIEEKFARELDSERRRMQTNSDNRNKTLAATSVVAPEAGPVISAVKEHMDNKDDKKLQKKEEKLMDKENKALDKSGGDNKKFMNRIDDLRQGPGGGR